MKSKVSLTTYRAIDLAIFTVLTIIFEILSVKALALFDGIYYITLFYCFALLSMYRWNGWAIIPIVASAVTYCIVNNGTLEHYLIYIIGNSFILINLLWFIKGKDRIRNGYQTICYVASGYILVELGRSIVASLLGNNFLSLWIGYMGVESFSVVIALVIIAIAKRQEGIFEDQITYLKRINKESNDGSIEVNQ